uniref:Uncharacterized protein n=1 Tax=Glossina palpalis gambiensis TaxID=67801 RepID=A0A1B0BP66_9MUSC
MLSTYPQTLKYFITITAFIYTLYFSFYVDMSSSLISYNCKYLLWLKLSLRYFPPNAKHEYGCDDIKGAAKRIIFQTTVDLPPSKVTSTSLALTDRFP